tara:strand:+ start:25 stop:243 length:219 start_codon:yes stop_codon:yes gene_type:complete
LETLLKIIEKFDFTEIFKSKGKLKKWSAKRSIGGLLVTTAVHDMSKNGINEYNLSLSLIGVFPLCLSFFEAN